MNLAEITTGLNEKQAQSVTLNSAKNALILAGAGSGKTQVLIRRIAYLISQEKLSSDNILAVTFTNKAVKEMRERLQMLLNRPIQGMWVGTFHGLSHRLLRAHYQQANLGAGFQILDAQDQSRIIKRLMKENQIDEVKFPVKKIGWFINQQKDEGVRPDDIAPGYNLFVKKSVEVFKLYEAHCRANDLIDFAEILLRSYELLNSNPELLSHYQNRFKHILIDEFQDTNSIQYRWIKLLFSGKNKVFCVGDDDQSIYGWRGARIENIQRLEVDFKPLQTIRLEQNYRSTGNILSASNALIVNNLGRMDKSLWTDSNDGEKIDMYKASSEIDEADFVVTSIQKYTEGGAQGSQCAILYRSNAQSRAFEERLIKYNIAYRIYGGLRFFERAEIKDAICYLRLMENPADNIAFERVVNFPARGIGNATVEKLRQFARQNHSDLYQTAKTLSPTLPMRAANALTGFIELIEKMADETKHLELSEKVAYLIKESGLIEYYSNEKSDKTGSKKDNLEELIAAAKQYRHEQDESISETAGFIALASLDSSGDDNNAPNQSVQLMTIHAAKGLEFPYVFLTGMEEDLFPSRQSKEEPHLIDEERRLCYVGMTRAMQKLHLSFAIKRFLHGQYLHPYPSRFLREIPDKYTQKLASIKQSHTDRAMFSQRLVPEKNQQLSIGANVRHGKFGYGTVLNFEGSGDSARVQVNFKQVGTKWLISTYANLEFV